MAAVGFSPRSTPTTGWPANTRSLATWPWLVWIIPSRRRQSFHEHWKNAPPSCVISPGMGPNGVWTEAAFCWAATRLVAISLDRAVASARYRWSAHQWYLVELPGVRLSIGHTQLRVLRCGWLWSYSGADGVCLEPLCSHEIDRLHPLAAPLRADLKGLPPVLLVLPEMDILRSEGDAMAAKLAAAGVPVQTEVIQGMVHGFLRACGTVQKARDTLALIGEWLRGHAGA